MDNLMTVPGNCFSSSWIHKTRAIRSSRLSRFWRLVIYSALTFLASGFVDYQLFSWNNANIPGHFPLFDIHRQGPGSVHRLMPCNMLLLFTVGRARLDACNIIAHLCASSTAAIMTAHGLAVVSLWFAVEWWRMKSCRTITQPLASPWWAS